jgi:hypothetical protein
MEFCEKWQDVQLDVGRALPCLDELEDRDQTFANLLKCSRLDFKIDDDRVEVGSIQLAATYIPCKPLSHL